MALNGKVTKTKALSGTLTRSSGGSSVQEIYWVQYGIGTATNAEVNIAVSENKLPICYWDVQDAYGNPLRRLYYLIRHTPTDARFAAVDDVNKTILVRRLFADSWSTQTISYQETLTWDTTPRSGSLNPVTSDGIYQAIQAFQPATDAQVETAVNTWLGNNIDPATGYVLDASLTMSNAAAPADKVGEIKSAFADYFAIDLSVSPALTAGKYVYAQDNSLQSSDNFSMTAPIPIKKGQAITLHAKGYSTMVGMIATCNADNTTRQVVVACTDSDYHDFQYTATEDGFVVCSFVSYNATYSIKLSIDYYEKASQIDSLNISEVGTEDVPIVRFINGKYVDSNGNVQSSSNFFISQTITLYKGQKLTLSARGYNQATAMISAYDAGSDVYTPLVRSVDSTTRDYEYTATNFVEYIRCSVQWYGGGANLPYSATITTEETTIGGVYEALNELEDDPLSVIQYPQIFTNIICMGDSLTVGYKGDGNALATHNYPFFFKKLTGAEATVQATGGITASGFWSAHSSDDYSAYDCAVIFLGTNGGLTDTVSTDCFADYTQNADTNTGAYGKIIGHIKATAPNCKVFLVAGVNDYVRRATTMNPAVRALAEFYEVGLIDIENCIMSDGGGGSTAQRQLYRPIDGIHYNTLGYMTMANMMYDAMSAFMGEHRDMYKIA